MNGNQGVNHILGLQVKNARKKTGYTREQLAEHIGVSTRFLADVEGGKVGVSLGTLVKLCHSLHTSADFLLGISSLSEQQQGYLELEKKVQQIPAEYLLPFSKIADAYLEAVCDVNEMQNS